MPGGIRGVAIVVVSVVAVLTLGDGATTFASHQPPGLQNAGFEAGALGGAPVAWSVVAAADAAVVTDEEGPADFATYADQNITVTAFEGNLMLRLGTPKRISQSQNRGPNTVSQTFHSDATSLTLAMRIFSWEHRGDDHVTVDLRDASNPSATYPLRNATTGQPLTVPMPGGGAPSCSATPCQIAIDVGGPGSFLDSDWLNVEITGMPDDGRLLTLTYSMVTEQNESHATWAYFDAAGAAQPPVAKFSFAPLAPLEGDFVQFLDTSFDPDADGSIIAWEWTIAGPNVPSRTISMQNPVFAFPNDGTYDVSLMVTDANGDTATVASGTNASDGTPVPAVVVGNASPLASALDVEVLEGATAPLVGRFLDPGWLDSHTASWSVGGASPSPSLSEEHEPALSSGVVTGAYAGGAAGDVIPGTLTVQDGDGGSRTEPFQISVLGENFERREPNDSVGDAPALPSGAIYLSDLGGPADIDLFEIRLPDGGALPANSQARVALLGLPADYDLVLLSKEPGGAVTAPFLSSPFLSSPFLSSPFLSSPFLSSPFLSSPFLSSPFLSSPFLSSPFLSSPFLSSPFLSSPFLSSSVTFDQFALSQLGFASPGGGELVGADVSVVELGLGSLVDEDLRVVGHSANRGIGDETALVRIDAPGTRLFAAVVGYNGAYSAAPYSLQVETSQPLDLEEFLGANCQGTPLVPAGTSLTAMLYDHPGTDLSLIVTQRERMMKLYDLDDAGWNALMTKLTVLANEASVAADIISVPSTFYDAWDVSPCSVDAANVVAASVRSEVLGRLEADPNKQYLVIAGNDDIVPHKRTPDEVVIGNESLYGIDSFLLPGTPLASSIDGANNLTDDYYVDSEPLPWQGRELYVPDWDIGRLVETPTEIGAAADAFVASGGQLVLDTALVTGYDFFTDGSQAAAAALGGPLATDSLIDANWSADDLRCQFLATAAGASCFVHDANATNAHYTHYAALSAGGFTQLDFSDYIDSVEVAGAGGGSALAGTLTFTIGCHAGLDVPDRAALPPNAGLLVDPRLDFAQAMARQRAVFIGNTGFGIGDESGIAGNEKLMAIFAGELAQGGSAGHALVAAKQQYLISQNALSVYDEKSSIQTTFYGLPQYTATVPQPLLPAAPASFAAPAAEVAAGNLTLTIDDSGTPASETAALDLLTTLAGSYITADGDAQLTAGRPVQPRMILPLPPGDPDGPVHGIVVRGGTFADLQPFDPVISSPVDEWGLGSSEPASCINAYWPSVFTTVNSLPTRLGLLQAAIVIPAQFRCTSGASPPATGIERRYDALTLEFLRSTSPDFEEPALASGGLRVADNGAGGLRVTADASDDSGIDSIVVYIIGNGILTPYDTGPLSGPGPYSLDVPFVEGERLVVQIVDGAGNVTTLTGKGINIKIVRVDAGPDQLFSNTVPTLLEGTVFNFDELSAETPSMSYVWDFGDGSFAGGLLAVDGVPQPGVTVDVNGDATFTVSHQYGGSSLLGAAPAEFIANLRVSDADGGTGVDVADLQADDGDGVDPGVDNCPGSFNPGQENVNGEPLLLPKPVPFFNDATNPAGDTEGDACDGDIDGDGLLNGAETLAGLSPYVADTDGDRTNDGTEVLCGSNPLIAVSNLSGPDSEGDNLPDACELLVGSTVGDPDSDDDGVLDGAEVRYWLSDPLAANSDLDDCADAREIASVNQDRLVNSADLAQLAQHFGALPPQFGPFDSNGDGSISSADLAFAAQHFGLCGP